MRRRRHHNNNYNSAVADFGQVAAAHNILVGAAAYSPDFSDTSYSATLGSEYSQLQPENEMKFGSIHPALGVYDFTGADALVAYAQAHTMVVRGHTLVWHNQVPAWVPIGITPRPNSRLFCKTTSPP